MGTEHFHSRFNRVLAVLVWLFCAGALAAVVAAGIRDSGQYLPLIALAAFLGWAGLWNPSVHVSDTDVELVNVLQTIRVPWAALINVETRYALTLMTPNGRYTATAAPAPGRFTAALSRRDLTGLSRSVVIEGSIRPGDLPNTDSGAAAHLVRMRWEQLTASDRIELGVADTTPVTRRWHWPTITVILILTALSVGGLVLG